MFGNGQDSLLTLTGTEAPIDASCSGDIDTKTLNATNASFASGQMILIYQVRGTGVGKIQVNYIVDYSEGVITLLYNLPFTCTDSGASQAYVRVIPQAEQVGTSGAVTVKLWDSNLGGTLAIVSRTKIIVDHAISGNGRGFAGGASATSTNTRGRQGEGSAGEAGTQSVNPNGNGGGGGGYSTNFPWEQGNGGGGGGHSVAGQNGTGTGGGNNSNGGAGLGGEQVGISTLIDMFMGGGGGSGGRGQETANSGAGARGGGNIILIAPYIKLNALVSVNGANASNTSAPSGGPPAAGGGGAGGSILIKAIEADIGTDKLSSTGGNGGLPGGVSGDKKGGNGAKGRIRVEACKVTGSVSSSLGDISIVNGGNKWCGIVAGII